MTSRRARRLGFSIGVLWTAGLLAPPARAAVYIVSPTGATTDAGVLDCTRATPCALSYAAANAQAGDTVVLLDGTYKAQLSPANSGTASAWITYQADCGAVPILDGTGTTGSVGVGSDTATYVRFVGLVSRNWQSGFSNQWTGSTTEFTANGNWQYVDCIGDGNTKNGFAFNSAKGVTIHQCISAHNGTSTTSSWSSGFQLYAVQGTASDNVVDENVAFENMDNQMHTDGSGFIVDTMVTGVAFINNLAFLNGGSCIRLTKSANISIINNTCYHNGRDTTDTGPTNPGEIYFTDGPSTQGLTMLNNVGVATGSAQDPTAAWIWNGGMGSITVPSNNKTSATFAGADGTNPDFHLASGSPLLNAGTSSNAPATDIGFDPMCITKGKPTDIAVPSWSTYSVNYTYIKSLGGVAKCWNPGKRPSGSGIDIGAYESGATPVGAATCTPLDGTVNGSGGAGGSSASGAGGASGTGGEGGAGATGQGGSTGMAGSGPTGGASGGGGASSSGAGGQSSGGATGGGGQSSGGATGAGGGSPGTGGSALATGGAVGSSTGGSSGTGGGTGAGGKTAAGGASGTGGSGNGATGSGGTPGQTPDTSTTGCSCGIGGPWQGNATFLGLLLVLVTLRLRRRRLD